MTPFGFMTGDDDECVRAQITITVPIHSPDQRESVKEQVDWAINEMLSKIEERLGLGYTKREIK